MTPAVLSYNYLVLFLLTGEVLRRVNFSYLKTLFNLSISYVDNLHQRTDYGNKGLSAGCIGKIFSFKNCRTNDDSSLLIRLRSFEYRTGIF